MEPDYRRLFEAAPDLYAVLDRALVVVAVTDAYLRGTMTERATVVGRPLLDVLASDAADPAARGRANLEASLRRVLERRVPDAMANQRFDVRDPDNVVVERRWSVLNTPVLDAAGDVAYVVHRIDDELGRVSRNKFLSLMSHDLRTPLNAIIGFSEVLLDEKFGPLDVRQKRFVGNVHGSGKQLLGLINDMLDLSRIEAGRLEVANRPCVVPELAEAAVTTLRPAADARGITLELVVPRDERRAAAGDPVRIQQLLFNLLATAIEVSPDGGRVTIAWPDAPLGDALLTRITAVDLTEANHARLVRAFSDAGSGDAAAELRLVLARSLAELMGGRARLTGAPAEIELALDLPAHRTTRRTP